MNRHVEVNVTGIHSREGEPTEKVETSAEGTYELLEDGSRVVEYDENQDLGSNTMTVHNRVQIDPEGHKMEIIRGGATRSRLAFGEKLVYDTEYATPYGSMQMKVRTNSFDFNKGRNDEEIKVVAEYDLEIEGQVVSQSMIVIDVKNAAAN
ncbi:MAG: DUF1934 domain-containing protein [Butyrivibrio sp.]|nr:DUF1934 domain-containing protein [Butyrivibrio sp.]